MTEPLPQGLLRQITSFSFRFWMAGLLQFLERTSYFGLRVVIPIYIAQADEVHGLHFTQVQKGEIFAVWALIESIIPMFSGGLSDRYGYKRSMALSIVLRCIALVLMASQTEFFPFLLSCSLFAFSTAIFGPPNCGTLIHSMKVEASTVGWGILYMMVNIGGFLGPPLAHFLYGYSWPAVFYGSAAVMSLNLIILSLYEEVDTGFSKQSSFWHVIKTTMISLFDFKLITFIILTAGFWFMFHQLFDILPNFIVDWVDTSNIVKSWDLPSFMTKVTSRGTMIAQEWMINLNAFSILVSVVIISWLVSKMRRLNAMTAGIFVSSIGLLIAGYTMSGAICLLGILVFSIGEMLASPTTINYLGVIAPQDKKGLFVGFWGVSQALGWVLGSIVGGQSYDLKGDKANLSLRYLQENFQLKDSMNKTDLIQTLQSSNLLPTNGLEAMNQIFSKDVDTLQRTNATTILETVTGMDSVQVTEMLWNLYHPYTLWYPLVLVGIAAGFGLAIFSYFAKRWDPEGI
jgi:MFS family permease